jgi:hypothetical protein
VRAWVESGRCSRIALVSETAADGRDVIAEGESGILSVCPPWNRPTYESSKRRITWPNGAIATLYDAREPDQLRGPQHDGILFDELAKYRYADDVFDNAMSRNSRAKSAPPMASTSKLSEFVLAVISPLTAGARNWPPSAQRGRGPFCFSEPSSGSEVFQIQLRHRPLAQARGVHRLNRSAGPFHPPSADRASPSRRLSATLTPVRGNAAGVFPFDWHGQWPLGLAGPGQAPWRCFFG